MMSIMIFFENDYYELYDYYDLYELEHIFVDKVELRILQFPQSSSKVKSRYTKIITKFHSKIIIKSVSKSS